MIKYILFVGSLFFLTGCGNDPFPKNPRYEIYKPKIKYKEANKENLSEMVKQAQGRPYVWAEEGPTKFDCSGYTFYMYGSMGVDIPRVAREQAKCGEEINYNDLKYGDLVFFDTTKNQNGNITHVGMYLGNDWFTHASTVDYKVVYSKLSTPFYKKRLKMARRYLGVGTSKFATNDYRALPNWQTNKNIRIASKKQPEKFEEGIFIQIGSYSKFPNRYVLNDIKKNGFDYKIIDYSYNGQRRNKLLIGPYKNKKLAINNIDKAKKLFNPNAYLVKID